MRSSGQWWPWSTRSVCHGSSTDVARSSILVVVFRRSRRISEQLLSSKEEYIYTNFVNANFSSDGLLYPLPSLPHTHTPSFSRQPLLRAPHHHLSPPLPPPPPSWGASSISEPYWWVYQRRCGGGTRRRGGGGARSSTEGPPPARCRKGSDQPLL